VKWPDVRRWREYLRAPFTLKTRLVQLWNHDFRDVRLILEHEGDLHYFHLTPRLQRLAVRWTLGSAGTFVCALLVFQLNTLRLSFRVSELEQTQQHIATALSLGENTPISNTDEAMAVAERLKSREEELVQMVETLSASLGAENERLWRDLQSAGVDRNMFSRLSNSMPSGGPATTPDMPSVADSLVPAALARNLGLKEVLRSLPSQWPMRDPQITSRYGLRRHPLLGGLDRHTGIDLISLSGNDTVRTVGTGRVSTARYSLGYGRMVVVTHPAGVETRYAHLQRMFVKEGQVVDDATPIGLAGNSGLSTGKHLHFEVRVDGAALNPDMVITTVRNVQQQ
jgi:murein DD-endopeptidase MepM/ murein hydrolase activator NlpD